MPTGTVLIGLLAAIAASACGARASQMPQQAERQTVWRQVGSWSGANSLQTESFPSDTGALRVRWETSVPAGAAATASAMFRLTAHSAISGRSLQEVVEQGGAGSGIAYIQQDPHVFYMVVESNRVNWKFTVEEAIGYP